MDANKLLPVLIVILCIGWFMYDRNAKETALVETGGLTMGDMGCPDVEQEFNTIGATAPDAAPDGTARARHFCRLHICGMSFMHGRTLAFPRTETGAAVNGAANNERLLKGAFTATDETGRKAYDFSCSMNADAVRKPGAIPILSASVVPRP